MRYLFLQSMIKNIRDINSYYENFIQNFNPKFSLNSIEFEEILKYLIINDSKFMCVDNNVINIITLFYQKFVSQKNYIKFEKNVLNYLINRTVKTYKLSIPHHDLGIDDLFEYINLYSNKISRGDSELIFKKFIKIFQIKSNKIMIEYESIKDYLTGVQIAKEHLRLDFHLQDSNPRTNYWLY